ncbi:MAG TPA: PAS domain-containing protein [Candidatus Paceibacterota bacterium]
MDTSATISTNDPNCPDLNLLGLLDNAPMCIKLFNPQGTLMFINKFGRLEHHIKDTDDISKWDWVNTVKPAYQNDVKAKFRDVLQGKETAYVEFEHTPEGSDHQWCAGALSSYKDEKGDVTGVLFYSIDATARKRAETEKFEKLTELERINKMMVDRELKMVEMKKELDDLKAASQQ